MTNSNPKCDLSNPDFNYSYCPSTAAAVLFAALFSVTTAGHVYQAWRHRKPFAAVLVMGGIWEAVGYVVRTVSIHNPLTSGLYTAQMLLILLAPLWINAFVYMLVGRMVHFFFDHDGGDADRVFAVKARKFTLLFVLFDVVAFLVQGTGGSMTSSDTPATALTGLHVYTGGVALQILFIAVFLAITVRFHKTALSVLRGPAHHEAGQHTDISRDISTSVSRSTKSFADCMALLRLVYIVIGLILFRNFYRLAEFASGLDNTIIKHEWYAYVFDAIPMLAAMIIINVFHPGRKLQGARCDFTEENRARKQAKKERKAAKKGLTAATELTKVPHVTTREISGDGQV